MYRQLKVWFFWLEFEKKLTEKNARNGVIMKIVTHKKSKDKGKASE